MRKVRSKSTDHEQRGTHVHLTHAEHWPDHHNDKGDYSLWHKARGMAIVIGKPVRPDAYWTCGTDFVWPVLQWNRELAQPSSGSTPFVCRHQIFFPALKLRKRNA